MLKTHALATRCGIGLRTPHYKALTTGSVDVGFVEAISENFMVEGGKPLAALEAIRRDRPVFLHGVSMCLGSTDPLDLNALRTLRRLADRIEPAQISDHLSWGSLDGARAHDLLPMPYTEEAVAHVARRLAQAQDLLGRRLALENVSSYAEFAGSTLPEWEFVAAVAEGADCALLLDLNNVVVNAHNHGFDPRRYLAAIPAHRVAQIHLAGHTDMGTHLLDSHVGPVPESVWSLYQEALIRLGPVPTLIEWDEDVPALPVVLREARRAETLLCAAARSAA